ncbi:MAG: Lrp/AsnC family transcriptional regulator [Candidatus Omnitrophica bacterium]|nr:Lrp/AsnC family transcriptional regulator [Candidatus Omnitrophota bacterium]
MNKVSRKILFALSEPFALVPEPYALVAKKIGISEMKLIDQIAQYQEEGIIRRLGIVYGHFKMGFSANALVVWKVAESDLENTGKIFAGFSAVTHCYARQSYPQWPYNLYTMVHAKSDKEAQATIRQMASKAGLQEYKKLSTLKEFKKIKSDLREILS